MYPEEGGIMLPVPEIVAAMYSALCDEGLVALGTQALIRYYENATNGSPKDFGLSGFPFHKEERA